MRNSDLELARRLQGMPDRRAVEQAIERHGLGEYAGQDSQTLSLGNLQRLALARAMLHEPELLVLDEPANGLDPAGVIETRELLRSLSRERGVTILMSSHILAEVDRLATRIGILHRGRLVEERSAVELEQRRDRRLEVGARNLAAAAGALRAAGFEPLSVPAAAPPHLELRDPRALDRPDLVAELLTRAGTPPTLLAVAQEDLEQHFMRLTTGAGPGCS